MRMNIRVRGVNGGPGTGESRSSRTVDKDRRRDSWYHPTVALILR